MPSEEGGNHPIFYDRNGCDTPVARRFFRNLESFVAQP